MLLQHVAAAPAPSCPVAPAAPGDLHIVGGLAGAAPFSCLPRLKPHTRNERSEEPETWERVTRVP